MCTADNRETGDRSQEFFANEMAEAGRGEIETMRKKKSKTSVAKKTM